MNSIHKHIINNRLYSENILNIKIQFLNFKFSSYIQVKKKFQLNFVLELLYWNFFIVKKKTKKKKEL